MASLLEITELLVKVFRNLSLFELHKVASVSTLWHKLLTDPVTQMFMIKNITPEQEQEYGLTLALKKKKIERDCIKSLDEYCHKCVVNKNIENLIHYVDAVVTLFGDPLEIESERQRKGKNKKFSIMQLYHDLQPTSLPLIQLQQRLKNDLYKCLQFNDIIGFEYLVKCGWSTTNHCINDMYKIYYLRYPYEFINFAPSSILGECLNRKKLNFVFKYLQAVPELIKKHEIHYAMIFSLFLKNKEVSDCCISMGASLDAGVFWNVTADNVLALAIHTKDKNLIEYMLKLGANLRSCRIDDKPLSQFLKQQASAGYPTFLREILISMKISHDYDDIFT